MDWLSTPIGELFGDIPLWLFIVLQAAGMRFGAWLYRQMRECGK